MNNSINYRECRRLLDKLYRGEKLTPRECGTPEADFLIDVIGMTSTKDGIAQPDEEDYAQYSASLRGYGA